MKILFIFSFVVVAYSSNYIPSKLPSFPLAVKSPYLSTWIRSGKTLYGNWPTFWNGNINGNYNMINIFRLIRCFFILAMAGLVRVDGVTYEFMGWPTAHEIGNSSF